MRPKTEFGNPFGIVIVTPAEFNPNVQEEVLRLLAAVIVSDTPPGLWSTYSMAADCPGLLMAAARACGQIWTQVRNA